MKLFSLVAAGLLAFACAPAGAATLHIMGGSAGTVSSARGNDALRALGLPGVLGGFYGGAIVLDGMADVTFTLLGFEAGYRNTLFSDDQTLRGGGGRRFDDDGLASFTLAGVTPGLLDFGFRTSGGGLSVLNGANPDNTGPRRSPGVNFFASVLGDARGRGGASLLLFFDDDGANNDDDHDDLVVRMDVAPVPLPAAGWLIVAGLGGLLLVRRRNA